jgi:2-C-methyl-D-erythritol 4-phosphate cytidylyltransferase
MEPAIERADVAVIVPAAGLGKRMGGMRKQFRTLGDAPLIVQTLRVFEASSRVGAIVVAAPSEESESLFSDARSAGVSKLVSVVPGGETRQASVQRALSALPAGFEIVLIHDAVRPFVSPESIARVVAAVEEFGAASLALEATDTLRRSEAGFFGETVDRDGVFRMQTPQGFKRSIIEDAYRRASEEGWEVTDDVEVARRCGTSVACVPGDERNMKITTAADWDLAHLLWEETGAARS